jgi:hypothetical protein
MANQPAQRGRQPTTGAAAPRGRRSNATSRPTNSDADTEDATDRVKAAEAREKLSKEKANALQLELTEHRAAAEESKMQYTIMKARLDAMESTAAEANARRTSSDGDSGGAGESTSSKKLPAGMKSKGGVCVGWMLLQKR